MRFATSGCQTERLAASRFGTQDTHSGGDSEFRGCSFDCAGGGGFSGLGELQWWSVGVLHVCALRVRRQWVGLTQRDEIQFTALKRLAQLVQWLKHICRMSCRYE